MHSQKYRNLYVPLALAGGRGAVWAVTSLLVKLRDVYQVTHKCTINTLQYKNYDVHECILTLLKICMTWQFAKLTQQTSQTKQELNLGQGLLAWHFY